MKNYKWDESQNCCWLIFSGTVVYLASEWMVIVGYDCLRQIYISGRLVRHWVISRGGCQAQVAERGRRFWNNAKIYNHHIWISYEIHQIMVNAEIHWLCKVKERGLTSQSGKVLMLIVIKICVICSFVWSDTTLDTIISAWVVKKKAFSLACVVYIRWITNLGT